MIRSPSSVMSASTLLINREPRRRNNPSICPELSHHLFQQPIDKRDVSVVKPGLNAGCWIRAYQLVRPADVRVAQPGGSLKKRGGRYLNAGVDNPAKIFSRSRNCIEGRSSAEVNDDARTAVSRQSRNRVDNPIRTDFCRIVIEYRDAGIVRADEQRLKAKINFGHLVQGEVERWHDRRDRYVGDG